MASGRRSGSTLNGYRARQLDTRAGSIELSIPKLREGSYFPGWLLEPRRRAERALTQVVCQCYVEGVSTRRVDDVVRAMGMAAELDTVVDAFRNRPLDAGPYTYVWLDALTQKVREAGRVINVAVVVATGVNANGNRELLDVITTEDGAGWTAFLRGLVARGLSGVALVVSDDHTGLKAAIGAVLTGAAWQRCRTHYAEVCIRPIWSGTTGGAFEASPLSEWSSGSSLPPRVSLVLGVRTRCAPPVAVTRELRRAPS
jgi:putative transposase